VYKTYTEKTIAVYKTHTGLCTKRTRINTQVIHREGEFIKTHKYMLKHVEKHTPPVIVITAGWGYFFLIFMNLSGEIKAA